MVTGAEPAELARFGVHDDKVTRSDQTGEFIEVLRGAWSGEPFTFSGRHYQVEGATTRAVADPVPDLYFGGASAAAEKIAARHVDVYLAWSEPRVLVAPRLERLRGLAAAEGRTLRFGIRFHVIARPTTEEAWAFADRLLAGMDPAAIGAAQRDFAATQSVGQQRIAALHGGDPDRLLLAPNLWAGIGLARGGVGTALVDSYEEAAERIAEYQVLGFEEFIFSGYPHLEEAYWFGEGVMPVLRAQGLLPAFDDGGAPSVFSFR